MLAKAERFPNARARVGFYPGCQGTPRVKRFQTDRLFSDRGAKPFLWSAFLSGNFFLCAVLCGCAGVEGAFPCGGVPSWPKEEKRLPRPLPARGARLQTDAEPGYFPPQTLRLSAGRSNHLWLFRWKNLAQIRNRLLCFPPAAPPRFPAQNTRKTTPSRDRLPSLGSHPADTAQRACPAKAARPGLPPGAPPGR